MRNKFFIILFLALFLENYLIAQAQTEPAFTNFFGKISAINADSGEITIVTAENTSFVVNAKNVSDLKQVPAGETRLQNSTAITFSQISVDDKALIRGKLLDKNNISAKQIVVIKKTDLEKKYLQEREDWKQRGVTGIVVNTDSLKRKISVQIKGQTQLLDIMFPGSLVIQRYKTNAVNMKDFSPITFEEVKEGDQIRLLGNKSADGLHLDAEKVFVGVFSTQAGKVVSIDPQNNELKIVDANNKVISVAVNSESNIRRLTPDFAGNGTIRPNEADGKINLTSLLEMLPRVNFPDIKVGEIIAVASSSNATAEKVVGLVVVIGVDVFKSQPSKKSAVTPKKFFNLDVF